MTKFDSMFQAIVRVFLVSLFFFTVGVSRSSGATLKGLTIEDEPSIVRIALSERVPFKVVRVDGNEVLIALKNVDATRVAPRLGKPGALIKNVVFEDLSNGVVALVITGTRGFDGVVSGWGKTGATLVVSLGGDAPGKKRPKPRQQAPLKKNEIIPPVPPPRPDVRDSGIKSVQGVETVKSLDAEAGKTIKSDLKPSLVPKVRASSIYRGDITDILRMAPIDRCTSREMPMAVEYLKKGLWNQGRDAFTRIIEDGGGDCSETAYYLRAYAGLMGAGSGGYKENLAAVGLFQDALVAYPDSSLLPFALAGLGILHARLKNPAAAEGFFAIVRDNYRSYPGLAQVLYHLGLIYDEKGYNEQAMAYFKEVFEELPENSFVVDAGIGIGKVLFKKRFYIDSLKILSQLLKSNPEKIYDTPELLLSIGNANFELARTAKARENLTRALNIFPDLPGKDMVLTSVAETYAIEKDAKRAESLYRLVIETYPKGEGFLNSSMGLATILKDVGERRSIYEMVKKDFPDHRLANVAMMRLAEIYEKEGEYAKCISEIEALLATHPQGLRYEAVKLMERAYEALFDQKLEKGLYPDVLQLFEQQNALLERMESKKVYLAVGLAYLEARLHEQAFNQLIKAYKLYPRAQRPEPLLFGLGVAMDETDRKEDALKILEGFAKRFPASDRLPRVCLRMGNILMGKGLFSEAVQSFDKGYGATRDPMERGTFLVQKGEVYRAQKEWGRVSNELVEAAKAFALAPGTNYDLLASTYIKIGESFLEQKLYVKAAEAFVTALKFTGGENPRADIGFMLGDAYQKANVLAKAREAFERILAQGDSIWVRLARERLATLDLAEKVKKS